MDHFETPNLGLIMYRANDIPSYLHDWNDTMDKLDMYNDMLNSRLYDYMTTLSNIYNTLKEHKQILDEALKNSEDAKQLANTVSKTIQSILDNYENLSNIVQNNYEELSQKINITTEQLTNFEGNFVPITQSQYNAMGSGRPNRVFLIIG